MPALARMIKERRLFLESNGMLAREERRAPIITKVGSQKGEFVAVDYLVISEQCRRIRQSAGLDEHLVELPDEFGGKQTDLSKYYGDIYRANYKHKANHTCSMTRGEINYNIGIAPPNTYSASYMGYMYALEQLKMSCKLHRWESQIDALRSAGKDSYPTVKHLDLSGARIENIIFEPSNSDTVAHDIVINIPKDMSGNIEIEFETDFGCIWSVTQFTRKD